MAPPPPGWVLLSTHVHDLDRLESTAALHRNTNEPSPSSKTSGWAEIKCATTRAPADDEDKAIVESVTLLARTVEPPDLSALAVRLRSEQYGFENKGFDGQPVVLVEAADDRIIVLNASFKGCHVRHITERFLVYDAADASLAAVPPLCDLECTPIITPQPLPVCRHAEKHGGYALAIMARQHLFNRDAGGEYTLQVLCLWPPPPSSSPLSNSPWGFKLPLFPPEKPTHLWAHAAFSYQGRAYWADLGQGLLSCDSDDVLSGGLEVPFRYVPLPPECQVCQLCSNLDHTWSRAISCCPAAAGDGGCIRLVCIGKGRGSYEPGDVCDACDGPEAPGDMAVTVWALDLATGRWRRDDGGKDLRVANLWELESFKAAGLPRVEPILPVLIASEDGGSVLCFSLQVGGSGLVRRLCRLDMRTMNLLPSPDSRKMYEPYLLDCGFFKNLDLANAAADGEEDVLLPNRRRDRDDEEDGLSLITWLKRSTLTG